MDPLEQLRKAGKALLDAYFLKLVDAFEKLDKSWDTYINLSQELERVYMELGDLIDEFRAYMEDRMKELEGRQIDDV